MTAARPVILAMPENAALTRSIAGRLHAELGMVGVRQFPDGESHVRIDADVARRDVVIVCALHRPDPKIVPLWLAIDAARDLGATRVGLVAPYLAYMRQDRRFQPGEALAARSFARLLSRAADFLATVDPHLHRIRGLDEIYTIPTRVAHAAPRIAQWVREHIENPVFVGPDVESRQWVAAVARASGAPSVVLRKVRHGDRDVEIDASELRGIGDRVPVLVDDILSTGHTLAATIRPIVAAGLRPPVCVAVHGVFAEGAAAMLERTGARIVTTNTIEHPTNRIDMGEDLAAAVADLLSAGVAPPASIAATP